MPQLTETVIDRYISLIDRGVHEPEALDRLDTVFAPHATVHLGGFGSVTGLEALREFYRRFYAQSSDIKHVWTTTALDDRTLEVQFIAVAVSADGELAARRGTERATLDADGLIAHLRAEAVPLTEEALP